MDTRELYTAWPKEILSPRDAQHFMPWNQHTVEAFPNDGTEDDDRHVVFATAPENYYLYIKGFQIFTNQAWDQNAMTLNTNPQVCQLDAGVPVSVQCFRNSLAMTLLVNGATVVTAVGPPIQLGVTRNENHYYGVQLNDAGFSPMYSDFRWILKQNDTLSLFIDNGFGPGEPGYDWELHIRCWGEIASNAVFTREFKAALR